MAIRTSQMKLSINNGVDALPHEGPSPELQLEDMPSNSKRSHKVNTRQNSRLSLTQSANHNGKINTGKGGPIK